MRWPEKGEWPSWFFIETGHHWVSVPLALVCAILVIYGLSLTYRAIVECRSWRALLRDSYDFWLGQFFLGDAILYGILVVATLRDSTIDLWVATLFVFIAFPALMAFRLWLIGRKT
jgi:hypothetical protein